MVGVKDSTGRYRMSDPRAMPKFESAKNPFRQKATTEAKQTELLAVARPSEASANIEIGAKRVDSTEKTEKKPRTIKPLDAVSASETREPRKIEAAKEDARKTNGARILEVSFPAEKGSETQRASAVAVKKGMGIPQPNLASRWISKISSIFSRSQPGSSRNLVARPGRSAVQYELSLDKVCVVRNDLSDSDLEVVRVKPPAKEKQGPSQADKPAARQAMRQHNNGGSVEAVTM